MSEKKTIVVGHIGVMDSSHDILMPGCLKPCTVPLTKNFDHNHIGDASVFIDGKEIKAEINMSEEFKGLYPAIGFKYKDGALKFIEGKNVWEVNDIDLQEVSLCIYPNVDETIKPIE